MAKIFKKYKYIFIIFLLCLILYAILSNLKCRIIIKDDVFIGIKSGIIEKKEDLKTVEVPDNVTEIGIFAFAYCTKLERVTLPDSIKEIRMGAFYDCQNLKDIKLPERLEVIRNGAFLKCKSLTEIDIPNDVRVIEEGAFSECSSLTNVQLPNTITEIKEKTFSDCINLKSVYLPDSIKTIGSAAFYNCSSLSTVRMSEGIESVGENVFGGTEAFKSSMVDEYGSIYFGKVLLYNNGLNDNVRVKDSTKVIANAVFINNSKLREIELPEGIIEIGDNCFENCEALKKIDIKEGLKKIGENSFAGSRVEEVKLPESITEIGYGAFNNCKDLYDINLPSEIESIAGYSLENTKYLNNIKPDEYGCKYVDNILLTSENNESSIIYIKAGTRLIGAQAFKNRKDIEEVYIPKSVETICAEAFFQCSNLRKVDFEDGIKLREIHYFTFVGCVKMENIDLPNSLTAIYAYSFGDCSFTKIKIPENVEYLDSFAIRECYSLKEIELPERVKGEYHWIETDGIKTPKLVFY